TIGILSLIILTLMSSSIFIVKSSDEISKTNNDKDVVPGLKEMKILKSLQEKIKNYEDIKNWGIEIISVSLEISKDKPIKSVIVEDPPKSGNYKLVSTLVWFDVFISYKTKDGRIITIKTDLPLLNNVNSGGIEPAQESEDD
ncbi:MAG: hypothetical protein ACK4GR_03035, partial [bacterium]